MTVSDPRYYDTARREIAPHLPARVTRLLDLGCGSGATIGFVRGIRAVSEAYGVEIVPQQAAEAAQVATHVWAGAIDEADLEARIAPGTLDLVLCLDVLEHLVDPWAVVRRVTPLLAPGGRLIVSVPNIRNYRFIWGLLTRGDFHYREFGLLDRTHLRFFVRATAIELATAGGLSLIEARAVQTWKAPDWRWALNALSGQRADELLAKQWLVVAERPGAPA